MFNALLMALSKKSRERELSFLVKIVNSCCSLIEEILFFFFGKLPTQLFKRIPKNMIGNGNLIYRKVTLKHTPLGTE